MSKKKDLEELMKKKVSPLIDESMKKNWGVVIPKIEEDITDTLSKNKLEVFIHFNVSFSDAKKLFKKEFFRKELAKHQGNVSQLAKFIGLDRRSIHRTIKNLGIEFERSELKVAKQKVETAYEKLVNQMIRETINNYKGLIQEDKIAKIYEDLPGLSRQIVSSLPHEELTWKQAETQFELEYLDHHLKKCSGNIKEVAKITGLAAETVSRKLTKLGLRRKGF